MSTFSNNHNINKKYIRCPYDSNHKIPSNRMPIHLIKCEKKSDLNLMVCPFNASHRMTKDDYNSHINECKSQRDIIDKRCTLLDTIIQTKGGINKLKISQTIDSETIDKTPKPIKSEEDIKTTKGDVVTDKGLNMEAEEEWD